MSGNSKESVTWHKWTSVKRSTAEKLIHGFLDIDISQENLGKIHELQGILDADKSLNLFLYFNHVASDDPALLLDLSHLIDRHNERKIVVPVSDWYYQWKNNWQYAAFSRLGAFLYDFDINRIVQRYQLDEPETYGYTEADAFGMNRKLMRALQFLRSQGHPITFLLAPEGHRSDTGAIGNTEDGISNIGRSLAPVIYCPVALTYPEGYTRKINANALHKPHIDLALGEFTYQYDRKEEVPVEALMYKLASVLPEHMRGKWSI